MGDSLNPTVTSRLLAALRPDWSRTLAARRVAAGALVILAAVAALRSDPEGDRIEIVVATRDLAPGVELTADDVQLETAWLQQFPMVHSRMSPRSSVRRWPARLVAAKC